MAARNDREIEEQEEDYPEYNVRYSTTEPWFAGVDMKIYEDSNGYTIYNDIERETYYTREHKDGVFIYTDIDTGDQYQGEMVDEDAGEYGSSEYKDVMYEGNMSITIGKGAVLKDMIGNMKHLSAPIYIIAKEKEFYFLMISDPAAGAAVSAKKNKKVRTEAEANRLDNGIYVKVDVKIDMIPYEFNDDVEDKELREKSVVIMSISADDLHVKLRSATKDRKIMITKKKRSTDISIDIYEQNGKTLVSSSCVKVDIHYKMPDWDSSYFADKMPGDFLYNRDCKVFADACSDVVKQATGNKNLYMWCGTDNNGGVMMLSKTDDMEIVYARPVGEYVEYKRDMHNSPEFAMKHREYALSSNIGKIFCKVNKFGSDKSELAVISRPDGVQLAAGSGTLTYKAFVTNK